MLALAGSGAVAYRRRRAAAVLTPTQRADQLAAERLRAEAALELAVEREAAELAGQVRAASAQREQDVADQEGDHAGVHEMDDRSTPGSNQADQADVDPNGEILTPRLST